MSSPDIELGLLSAIEADPSDQTAWLVLADWLEDQERSDQSELVRLSLRLLRRASAAELDPHETRWRDLVAAGVLLPLPRRSYSLGASGLTMEFHLIPPGSFFMGSSPDEARRDRDEGPVHFVRLTRGFWLARTAVTQAQWRAVLSSQPPGRFRGSERPVDGVSWTEAQEFLQGMSRLLDLPFRLPSEAEWEYACRAGTTTPFYFGSTLSSKQANFDGNHPYPQGAPAGPWLEETTPVGSYPPNAFGLFDMHGNVWEWCQDIYGENYYSVSPTLDPPGPSSGSLRVLRGGSWYSYSWSCRSAGREHFAPQNGAGNYGFRVALTHEARDV